MVGHSKIVEISRNVPLRDETAFADEAEQDMITAIKRDDEETFSSQEPIGSDSYDTSYQHSWDEDAEPVQRRWGVIFAGTMLILLFLTWTGFWGWANQTELLSVRNPARIVELVGLWAIPVTLIALCWLLAMRLSTTEARRFGDVATLLRTESVALETRIKTINGEISLARSFLAENARELESVGRASAAKLTEAAEQLVVALSDSDLKAQMLENVSSAAVNNVELLRNHLPVVTSAAKDATNQIGNAGNIATQQIQSLIASLRTMDEMIVATSSTMNDLEQKTEETSQKIGAAANDAATVLDNSTSQSQARTLNILAKLQTETAQVEQRIGEAAENISALGEGSSAQLTDNIAKLQTALREVDTATREQDVRINDIVSRIDASLDGSAQQLATINLDAQSRLQTLVTSVGAAITNCDNQLSAIDTNATDRIAKLAFAINALSESSGDLGVNLAANEQRASTVLSETDKLLSKLGDISQELGGEIPATFRQLQQHLNVNAQAVTLLRAETAGLDDQALDLTAKLGALNSVLETQKSSVDALLNISASALVERQGEIDALTSSLKTTHSLIDEVSVKAEEQLSGSLSRVADAAHDAAVRSKAIVENEFAEIGARLTEQNRALLAGAIDAQLAEMGSAVKVAIDRNIRLSEDATQRVTAQLQSVNELTINLEKRAAVAREQFGGIDDEAFARRIALLTESLNSAAIDVAKILSNEVTDTSWAAYLKGDRGVFTRRAVRLLDSGEARIIASHYDDDTEFRDHVNRYIHDFESMMRVLLSTRDGNAIGVTLLSSDVGKLYVALAQAIDRLRN